MGLPSTAPKLDLTQPGLDRLIDEIENLKRRVSALEARAGEVMVGPDVSMIPAMPPLIIDAPAGAAVLLGKALVGIAGAYLLRALTDAAMVPRGAGLAAGIVYAGVWLYVAARASSERSLAAVLDACTAAVIVGPLLWEATLRLHAISSWTAASVLVAFALLGLALSWQKHTVVVARVSVSAAAIIAIALLIGIRDLLPFTLAILIIAAVVEVSACRGFRMAERWLIAVLADLAVLFLIYIVTRKGGVPEGYVSISSQAVFLIEAALATIYATSTLVLTFAGRGALTSFEIAQTAVVLAAGFWGVIETATGHLTIGLGALAAGAGCYVVSFAILSRDGRRGRNYFTYAVFGPMLVIAGASTVFSGLALAAAFSLAALTFCRLATPERHRILALHGAVYLVLASLVSGAALESLRELLGSIQATPHIFAYVLLIAAALGCYLMVVLGIQRGSGGVEMRLAALTLSANLAWLVAGAAAWAVLAIGPAAAPTLGTAVVMSISLALALGGVRFKRAELVWLVYVFMVLGAYRLLTQDFTGERTLPLVVSLVLYGSTLILLPRILQRKAIG